MAVDESVVPPVVDVVVTSMGVSLVISLVGSDVVGETVVDASVGPSVEDVVLIGVSMVLSSVGGAEVVEVASVGLIVVSVNSDVVSVLEIVGDDFEDSVVVLPPPGFTAVKLLSMTSLVFNRKLLSSILGQLRGSF